jgi:hypothetical protein
MIQITRYRRTRFWAVWRGETLLAVTVYKKGAQSVAQLALMAQMAQSDPAFPPSTSGQPCDAACLTFNVQEQPDSRL